MTYREQAQLTRRKLRRIEKQKIESRLKKEDTDFLQRESMLGKCCWRDCFEDDHQISPRQ